MRKKRPMKNKKRESKKLLEERALLVKAALDAGALSRKEICTYTGLKHMDLANLFRNDRELFAIYTVAKKTIVDEASDGLHEIVRNEKHPQHFQACKYVLQTYKSELDEVLESQDSTSLEISSEESSNRPVVIKFRSKD